MYPSDDDLSVGLIGFGMAGRVFHAPVISRVPGMRLAAIVQPHGDTAAAAYPAARVVRTVDELLADESIRLVVVATPNTSHANIAMQCLEAGRHVVVDKPLATTIEEAEAIEEVARRTGRVLSVFHNRRWDGDFLTLQKLADARTLGRIVGFESRFERYRPTRRQNAWREQAGPGNGILFDLGPHLIDQALVLFGLPDAVTADVRTERDDAVVDDAFDVVLHYPGSRAALHASMLASAPGPRFELRGTSGSYVKYHLDPQETRLGAGTGEPFWEQEPRERWGTLSMATPDGMASEVLPTEAGDYRRYYENVRDAICGRAALAVTPTQALAVMRLLELASRSSREKRTLEVVSG
jgi:scyllo-inositol 2-dehydrogenase (NADP+)